VAAVLAIVFCNSARADVVMEWNQRAQQSLLFSSYITWAGYIPVEPAASNFEQEVLPGATDDDDSEVWVTSQGTHRLFILSGDSNVMDTVQLPAGTGPHISTFSPRSQFAYVSGMGDGKLYVLDADARQVIRTLSFGTPAIPALTHQAKPSPDGSILLVANIASKTLFKVGVSEFEESWVVDPISLTLDKAPICTVFRNDGRQAYVSLRPSGIAIVDVPTMTLQGMLDTDGFVACGMIKSRNGKTVTIASSGGGGHIYRLDTTTDTLSDAGTLGAADWHSFNISSNQRIGFGSSPHSDELILAHLEQPTVTNVGSIKLDPTPGIGNDEPDALSVKGNRVYVSLRESGKLAIVRVKQRTVSYIDLSPPNPNFNEITCAGCAVHGVTVRR
jgi:DNA-binding beta-propeller fold protein YncE